MRFYGNEIEDPARCVVAVNGHQCPRKRGHGVGGRLCSQHGRILKPAGRGTLPMDLNLRVTCPGCDDYATKKEIATGELGWKYVIDLGWHCPNCAAFYDPTKDSGTVPPNWEMP